MKKFTGRKRRNYGMIRLFLCLVMCEQTGKVFIVKIDSRAVFDKRVDDLYTYLHCRVNFSFIVLTEFYLKRFITISMLFDHWTKLVETSYPTR
jgi:hypothetical protein